MTVGRGTVRGCGTCLASCGRSRATRGLDFPAPPLGPPGRKSLPLLIGLAGTGFPFGVGLLVELGASPEPTWMVEDL